MSKIDKLKILGVRSFDNTRSETIQFHTPLTLIVGYNGSGKTTIIECLKYATTGDLPPNSKGGAFIHDPKLCGEKEVLAQVKMSFKGNTGATMVVTRSVQLIVKKNTRQQKTLEGQLMTIKNGERTAISTRNAELDQLVPQYLGVSRAVLDSVIFCHQDESLWPMSEPSVLKKKFDEIFEALKYTKAIDNIKMLRKKQNEELGKFKLLEQTAKTDKDRADRAEKQSKELSAELDELRADVTQLHTKTKEAEENSREAWNQMAQYQQVVDSLKLKREKQAWYQRNLEELGKDLKERNESDEWLQSEVDQHEQRMAEREKRKEQLHRQYGVLDAKIKGGEDKLRDRHVEAGKYENQKASHEQQVEMRTAMIKDTARHHNIRGYDTDLDDMQINEYLDRISRLLKDQNTAVEKVRRETEREMKKSRDVLSKLGERRSALNEAKNSKKQEAATNDRRIALFQSELNHMEFDEGGKAILEANIEELEVRIRKAKENAQKASWDSKLDESETQLRGLEGENEQLNRDLVRGTKLAGELARLDHLKKEVTDRQRNLDKMTSVHNGRLRDIVGHDWQPSTLEVNFQKVHDQRTRQVKDAERKREGISRGLEQIEYKMSNVRSELKKGEKELASCAKRLSDAAEGEPEDYPSVLEEMQEGRDTLKADVDNFENERKYFSGGITLAHKEHKCKLCLRGFQGNEQKDFISRLEKKLEKDAIAQFRKELSDLENDLRKAKDAGPCYDTWLRLSGTEIPRLRAEEKRLGAERDNILQEIEEHDKIVNDREEEKRDAELLAKPVSNIVKNHQDMTTFSGQIQELTAKQNDTGISRTLEDIQEQMEVLGGKIRSVRKSRDRLTADKERARSQISTLELDLSNATNKLSGAKHQLEKKTDILQRVEDLRNANGENREKIKQVDTQLQDLAPQIAEEETKLDDIKQRGSDKERDLQQEASRLSESVRKLTLATQNIEAYFENGGPSKLEKCYRDMENAQQEIERIQEEQKQVVVSMNKIERELRDHDETRRTITDNIKYRRSLRDLEEVQTVIAELSAKNAEADQSHWQKLANHWQRQYTDLTTQKTSKLASAKAKDDQLTQLIRDWETDYKDAAYKFKKAHIEVETTKAAVEDLGRYGGALDKAIMKYHGIKMEEINRIIEELWKKTYQGTDVDTILIRSDNEATKGNRSYNYRVCMVKQDAEMDMRGRCSAGQKVLASIIIRLALAECFGVNCGLIALDEPTTNLDRDNIRSLAGSLHDIIENRRHQSNFQLIVITHDEEFLKFMKCPDFCDNYYRISRNERQKSIIERQSIAEVM